MPDAAFLKVSRTGGSGGNVCCKCGGVDPAKRFHASDGGCVISAIEHLHMTCGTCEYEWPTAPLDAI